MIFIFVLIPLDAWPQVERGTIVVLYAVEGEATVAADSRAMIADREFDNVCKISTLGNKLIVTLAGQKGFIVNHKWAWDATAIAHQVFLRISSKSTLQNLPLEFADAWGRALKKKFMLQLRIRPRELLETVKGNSLANGLVVGRGAGEEVEIYVVAITYRKLAPTGYLTEYQVTPFKPPGTLTLGEADISNEIANSETERGRRWHEGLIRANMTANRELHNAIPAIGIVDLTIRYLPPKKVGAKLVNDVGGFIDAVKIDRSGNINWIRRKGNCPAD